MPYQNVTTPKFYIDHGLWLSSLGAWQPTDITWRRITQLNPTGSNILGGDGEVVFDEFAQTYNTRGFNTWDDAWSSIKNDESVPWGAAFSYNNSLYKKELREQ